MNLADAEDVPKRRAALIRSIAKMARSHADAARSARERLEQLARDAEALDVGALRKTADELASAACPAPSCLERPGPPTFGVLSPDFIQAVVLVHFGAMRRCYEEGLAREPALRGRVATKFVIRRDGRTEQVADGGSDLPDTTVLACVRSVFEELRFPPPHGDNVVTVVYPTILSPG